MFWYSSTWLPADWINFPILEKATRCIKCHMLCGSDYWPFLYHAAAWFAIRAHINFIASFSLQDAERIRSAKVCILYLNMLKVQLKSSRIYIYIMLYWLIEMYWCCILVITHEVILRCILYCRLTLKVNHHNCCDEKLMMSCCWCNCCWWAFVLCLQSLHQNHHSDLGFPLLTRRGTNP